MNDPSNRARPYGAFLATSCPSAETGIRLPMGWESRMRSKPSFNDFAIGRHPHASSGVIYIDFVQDDPYCLKRPAVCNDKHGLRTAQLQVGDQRLNAGEQPHKRSPARRSGSSRRMSNESLKFVTGLLF